MVTEQSFGDWLRRRRKALDLTQAEAIADLISSGSAQAARAALASLQGKFSQRVQALAAAKKCAFGKLPGTRLARAQLHRPLQQHIKHHGSAVCVKLCHVFPSERAWGGKVEGNAAIYRCASVAAKRGKSGLARGRQTAEQCFCNARSSRAGDANDTDCRNPCRCGDGGDGVGGRAATGRPIHWIRPAP